MDMKTVKTASLIYEALDWAVAKCEGKEVDPWHAAKTGWLKDHRYSADRELGGQIIDRWCISVVYIGGGMWEAYCDASEAIEGCSSLEAAMRCYVASKLGDEIDVPAELVMRDLSEFVGWSCCNQMSIDQMKEAGVVAVVCHMNERKIKGRFVYPYEIVQAFRSKDEAIAAVAKLSPKHYAICHLVD